MKKEVDIEMLCRLNGMAPTTRQRWQAFYRLWRITQRAVPLRYNDAEECFKVLMNDWSWIMLVTGPDDCYKVLRFMPRPIRKWKVGMTERLEMG